MRFRCLTRAVALLEAALLLTGCLSVQTKNSRPAAPDAGGGVAVRVYADDDARRAGRPTGGVASELERREGERWLPVFHSLDGRWTAVGLPPGNYRLTFPERLDENGLAVKLDSKPRQIAVRTGQVTQVEATLSHVPKALVAAGIVVGAVAAIALAKWLDDHDLLPPAPPPFAVEAVLDVGLQVAATRREATRFEDAGPPPLFVTSHFPSEGATVVQPRVRITFSLSQPIDGAALAGDTVVVAGERAGPVAGHVTYDDRSWWVVWEPDEDLPADDTLHATLRPEGIVGRHGEELAAPAGFAFTTRSAR